MSPIVLLVVAEDAKELFHFLIYAFCFTICLRMKDHRQGLIYVKLAQVSLISLEANWGPLSEITCCGSPVHCQILFR